MTRGAYSSRELACVSLLRFFLRGPAHTDRYQDPLATLWAREFLAGSVYARVAAEPGARHDGSALRAFPDERQQFRCGARPKKLVIGPGQQVGRPVESRRKPYATGVRQAVPHDREPYAPLEVPAGMTHARTHERRSV